MDRDIKNEDTFDVDSAELLMGQNAAVNIMEDVPSGCFDALSDWREPQDTLKLCQHVATHGTALWEALALQIGCPASLCALRWHTLWLSHHTATTAFKLQKTSYSDWERCVLYLAVRSKQTYKVNKRERFHALTNWVPGRTATGLKQAHIAHVQGSTAKMAAVLKANGWPDDLTQLLVAWPGPHADVEENVHMGVKEAAAAFISMLPASQRSSSRTTSLQRQPRSRVGVNFAASAPSAFAVDQSVRPRKLQRTGATQPQQALQQLQCTGTVKDAQRPHTQGCVASDFEQILYNTIQELIGGADSTSSGDSGWSVPPAPLQAAAPGRSKAHTQMQPHMPHFLEPQAQQARPISSLAEAQPQASRPAAAVRLNAGMPAAARQLQELCVPALQQIPTWDSIPAVPAVTDSMLDSTTWLPADHVSRGGSQGLLVPAAQCAGSCSPSRLVSAASSDMVQCFQQQPHQQQSPASCCSIMPAAQGSLDAVTCQLQRLGALSLPQHPQAAEVHDKDCFGLAAVQLPPLQQQQQLQLQPQRQQHCCWQQQQLESDAWKLVGVLQQRIGHLEQQQDTLLGRIDKVQQRLELVMPKQPYGESEAYGC